MTRMISPNELHQAACREYLGGREPVSEKDWQLCVNYWAHNIALEVRVVATVLMAKIMSCPLSETAVREIAEFQSGRK